MALVLEGCDCSGKSTLAKSLNWPIMTSPQDMGLRGEECLQRGMDMYSGFTIWERWWLTELVYAKVLNRPSVCDKIWKFRLKLLADVKGTVIVWMDPSKEELKSRYEERSDDHSLQTIFDIRDEYRRVIQDNWQFLPHFHTSRDLQTALLEHETAQAQARKFLKFNVDSWGTLRKHGILICAEALNPETKRKFNLKYPFDFPHKSFAGCGRFFFECLLKTSASPGDIHIMNLWHSDGSQGEVVSAIRYLSPRIIISLGDKPFKYFKDLRKHTIKLNHPAHQKRFSSHKQLEYINKLQEAIDSE
jgi:hypothetical protein